MSNNYLNPKQPIGAHPYADENVEAVGSCCLDVNGKPAYLVRGRGGGVWVMIFGMFFTPVLFTLIYLLGFITREQEIVKSDLLAAAFNILWISVLSDIIIWLTTLYLIRIWRTHIPLRFNRKTRKIYFHHWGKTFISDWDNIRAYLRVKLSSTGSSVTSDPQVHIEFQRENGSTFEVFLRAKKRGYGYYDAAAFWEYIRVYMEEGPKKLPKTDVDERDSDVRNDMRGILRDYHPFSLFKSDTFMQKARGLLLFLLALPLFALFIPTDFFYFRLFKRIKVNPFPPELADPCLCNESKEQQEKRLAEIRTQIKSNRLKIHSVEQSLRNTYDEWFVELRFPGHERLEVIDGVPEGWYRVALTDLVELNPTHHIEVNQESWYLPVSALPESGMIIEQNKLERCPTPTSTIFRNGDTLFPRISPWLEKGQPGFVEFLASDEVACGSEELIVMRGKGVSPEFTYCLATNRHLREYALQQMVGTAGTPHVDPETFSEFLLPMPPLALLNEFDKQHAKPSFQEIKPLLAENARLRKALANFSTAVDVKQ